MKTLLKIFVVIILIGALLIIGAVISGLRLDDFNSLFIGDDDFELVSFSTDYDADKIVVNTGNNIVKVNVSEDENFNISYYQAESYVFTYTEENGEINLSSEDKRFFKWFKISTHIKVISIDIPVSFLGKINILTNNGDIDINDIVSEDILSIRTKNGDITISNIQTLNKLSLITNNGNLKIKNSIIDNDFTAQTNNGNIVLEDITCNTEIYLTTDNGQISSSNITATKVRAVTSNGNVSLDDTFCTNVNARSSNGNVVINIKGDYNEYNIDITTSNGINRVNGQVVAKSLMIERETDFVVKAKTNNGNCFVNFS